MKLLKPFLGLLTLCATIAITVNQSTAFASTPDLVYAPVETAYAPLGFDTNDNVEIIVHGHFPNTCYKVGPSSGLVDTVKKIVKIRALAYHYTGVGCAMLMVPFVQSVKLGNLESGTYSVQIEGSPDAITTDLVVTEARSTLPDDYLYAPVSHVDLDVDASDDGHLTIGGEYPLMLVGCMVLRDVRVSFTPGNVLVVQPIAELTDGPECDPRRYLYKFAHTTLLPKPMPDNDVLVHVRVLNGDSVNRLFDLSR